jgi:undecaprenyl-diphosphatase
VTNEAAGIDTVREKIGYHSNSSQMPIYQVIVLAVIQGLTEFLPVSSSAHLVVVPQLLGWQALPQNLDLTFDVALHAGTLLAVLIYFFRDWVRIIANGLGMRGGNDRELRQNRNLLWLLALGSIPVGIAGLLFEKQAEQQFRSLYIVGGMLILVGILIWIADRRTRLWKDLAHVNAADAITIGVAQAVAIIPGTSRSGITISAGLFRNFDRATAARFSFLLSTPAIAAAVAKKAWDVHKLPGGLPHGMALPLILGVTISGIVGAIVIAFFMQYLRRNSLAPFVWYRIVFGIIVIALAYFRVIAA